MKDITKIKEAAIYVGTYGKYNNGSIDGKWMNLADYSSKEDFLEACAELHKDEDDDSRELMFQDWENIPDGLVGESYVSPVIWDLMEADERDLEIAWNYIQAVGLEVNEENLQDIIEEAQDRFYGEYDSYEDLAYDYVENGGVEVPEWLSCYIDYEKMGRELAWDFYEFNGFYYWTK